jgi:type III secretion system low calcium response chaperone LcrH/SycD
MKYEDLMTDKPVAMTQEELETLISTTLSTGATLKEIYDIPDGTMEDIYSHAYEYYTQGRLDEAESFFNFLCMYDLKNPDYFIGLGAVHQLKKNYHKACDLYSLAYMMAENNFSPVFFSGQCQLLNGDLAKAIQCFRIVSKRCDDPVLVKKANTYLETIKKHRQSQSKMVT